MNTRVSVRNFGFRFFTSFFAISRNARVVILTSPLFNIPFFLYNQYASLYMMRLGISPGQIGMIDSISFMCRLLASLSVGYVVDRLGRKKCAILFDILGWIFPLTVWMLGTRPVHFLIAGIANSLTVYANLISDFFLIEDTDPEERIHAYSFTDVLWIVSGVFVPITGLLISRFTLIPAMRGVYFLALVCMLILVACKFLFLTETSVGSRVREDLLVNRKTPVKELLDSLKYIGRKPFLIVLFSLNITAGFAMTINKLFYFPYLQEYLGLPEELLSVIPLITSIIVLAVLVFVLPSLRDKSSALLMAALFNIGGVVILILPFKVPFGLLMVNVVLWALARAFLGPVLKTMIANEIDDNIRANVMSCFNVVSAICHLPAGAVGGLLYEVSPLHPFYFVLAVYVITFLPYAAYFFKTKRAGKIGIQKDCRS